MSITARNGNDTYLGTLFHFVEVLNLPVRNASVTWLNGRSKQLVETTEVLATLIALSPLFQSLRRDLH